MSSVQQWMGSKIRRLVSIAAALVLLLGGLTAMQVVASAPAHATVNCGDVVLSGGSWLGGQGVDVHSNAQNGKTWGYNDCVTGSGAEVYNLGATPPQYGDAWQCVELAQRLYNTESGNGKSWYSGTFSGVSYAAQIYGISGLISTPYNKITSILPGDMIIHGTGDTSSPGYGHVAIVSSISGSTITAVQQNTPSATTTYTLTAQTLTGGSGSDITGIVNSSNNTNTGTSTTPPPSTPTADYSQQITGDFNHDGHSDIAVFYNWGGLQTKLIVFWGTTNSIAAPVVVWDSGPGNFDWTALKPVVGDFNSDGYDDIGVLYNWGSLETKLFVFYGGPSGLSSPYLVWDSGPGGWDWNRSLPVAGDFNHDGHSDIAVFYNYGSSTNPWTKIITFWGVSNTLAAPVVTWDSGAGNFDWTALKPVVGDFNSDGRTDIGVLYNWGGLQTKLFVFWGSNSGLTGPTLVWDSGPGSWDWTRILPVAGDFTGSGRTKDIAVFYNYGSSTNPWTKIITFWGVASGLAAPVVVWDSGPGNFDWTALKPVVGDFNSDGYRDISVFYNWGGLDTKLYTFWGTSSGMTSPTLVWDSGPGNWDWMAILAV